jgi:hypothetical protein
VTDNPDLSNKLLMSDEAEFHFHDVTFDAGQLQILTNLTSVSFMTEKLHLVVLLSHWTVTGLDEDGQTITVTSQRYRDDQ